MLVKNLINKLSKLDPNSKIYRLVEHPYDTDETYVEEDFDIGTMDLVAGRDYFGNDVLRPRSKSNCKSKNVLKDQIII